MSQVINKQQAGIVQTSIKHRPMPTLAIPLLLLSFKAYKRPPSLPNMLFIVRSSDLPRSCHHRLDFSTILEPCSSSQSLNARRNYECIVKSQDTLYCVTRNIAENWVRNQDQEPISLVLLDSIQWEYCD